MKKIICGILVVILLLYSACAQEQTFESVLADANALHKAQAEMVPEVNIRDYVTMLPETELGFTEEELVSLTEGIGHKFNNTKSITLTEAKEDVELLFRVLRYCYGVYEYFGGDEVFIEAKASVLNDLEALGNGFKASDMTTVLRKQLAFLQDGHFFINTATTLEMQSYFSTEELTFNRDKHGFYSLIEGEKQYLLSVDGDTDLEGYIKLSIGPNGELTYRLGMLYDNTIRNKLVSAAFEKTTVSLKLANSVFIKAYDPMLTYSEDWESDVPVVACRDLTTPETCNRFINSASRLSTQKIAILDLRGNHGGSPDAVKQWLDTYGPDGLEEYYLGTNSIYRSGRALSYILARTMEAGANYLYLWDKNNDQRNYYMREYLNGKNAYKILRENIQLKQLEAEGILFVLMDNGDYSAGEALLFALRNRQNAIFIGSNSSGCLLGGTGQQVVLPNSKITFTYGNGLMLWYDDRVFQEGRGFLPDIWVNGDALERVQKLIEYYGVE